MVCSTILFFFFIERKTTKNSLNCFIYLPFILTADDVDERISGRTLKTACSSSPSLLPDGTWEDDWLSDALCRSKWKCWKILALRGLKYCCWNNKENVCVFKNILSNISTNEVISIKLNTRCILNCIWKDRFDIKHLFAVSYKIKLKRLDETLLYQYHNSCICFSLSVKE